MSGDIIKRTLALLEKSGKQDKELCDYIGVAQSTFVNWKNRGTDPKSEYLYAISQFFNVSLEYLMTGNENTEFMKSNNSVRLPIYGSIPAGIPKEAIQDIEGYIEVPAYMSDGYFVLRVIGNSMYPKYLDGDVVIIKEQPDCESGQDCAVRINGNDVTLKKVVKMQDGLMLQPLNPDYTPQFFDYHDELCPVYILGVVVEIRRKV